MKDRKSEAIKMRQKNKSYNEINRILGISKSTLCTWFKDDKNSQKVKKILERRAYLNTLKRVKKWVAGNRARWEKWREEARIEARKEFEYLSKNPLFIAGMMLYWGEGDGKAGNPCRFTNTDPRMVCLFVKFLLKSLKIPKKNLRVSLVLYPDLKIDRCINFWSKVTGVSPAQFYKSQFIKGRHPTKRLSYGICTIIYGGRGFKEKIIIWLDLLNKLL